MFSFTRVAWVMVSLCSNEILTKTINIKIWNVSPQHNPCHSQERLLLKMPVSQSGDSPAQVKPGRDAKEHQDTGRPTGAQWASFYPGPSQHPFPRCTKSFRKEQKWKEQSQGLKMHSVPWLFFCNKFKTKMEFLFFSFYQNISIKERKEKNRLLPGLSEGPAMAVMVNCSTEKVCMCLTISRTKPQQPFLKGNHRGDMSRLQRTNNIAASGRFLSINTSDTPIRLLKASGSSLE